jgi:hypothetical protein
MQLNPTPKTEQENQMSASAHDDDLVVENAYIETQEWLSDLDRKVLDEDIATVKNTLDIDLVLGGLRYVRHYSGSSNFIISLQNQLVRKGSLSIPQVRGALNVLKDDLAKGRIVVARHRETEADPIAVVPVAGSAIHNEDLPVPHDHDDLEGRLEKDVEYSTRCFGCARWFPAYSAVMEHKRQGLCLGKKTAEKSVLDTSKAEESHLDLSVLPDGRYAATHPTAVGGLVFLSVRTVKRRIMRDRRFRYGRFQTGREWVEVGTIEVRSWSQDSKKLVGMQKPGEGYYGEFIDQLVEVMMAPKIWAMIFARHIGACSICGKTLTDQESRDKGIGPECVKKYPDGYWATWNRKAVVNAILTSDGEDQDDTHKATAATGTPVGSDDTSDFDWDEPDSDQTTDL